MSKVVQEVAQSVTPTESLVLVRNLLRTAISVITYTRNLFPEDCYADKVVAGLQIKTLLTRSKESSTLVDWMEKGVFDALEKRYLKTISLVICEDCNDKKASTLESYEFNVSYPDQENVMLQTTKGNTKKETMLIGTPQNKKEVAAAMQTMIRTLITLAQTMKVLPGSNFILFDHVVETRFVTMDLTYHDHTPDEYEPPFFRKMQIDEAPTWTSSESNKFTVGSVNTKHHAMELKVRVKQEAFSDEAITDVEEIILTPAKKHSQHASQPKQQVVEFPKPVVLAPVQQPSAMQVSDAEDDNTQPDMELEMQRMEEFIRKNDNVSMHELGKHFAHLSVGQLAEYVKQVKNKLNDEVYANAVAYVESLASVQVRVLAAKMDISSERASQLLDRMKQDGLVHDSASSQKKIVIKKKNVTAETQQQMVAPPETQQQAPTPATINPLSRKRKIGELEETTSQDASLVDSKLSTVATPIEQKRRRIYRDPKTIQ